MTRDEIRELAIERVASSLARGEGDPVIQHRHWNMAEAAIDALGDLLPTREVEQVDWAMSGSDQMTFTVVLQTEPRKVRKALW